MGCIGLALSILASIGINLQTLPEMEVVPDLPYVGMYVDGTVLLRDPENCHVLTHELIHHWQAEQRGPVRDEVDWIDRELEARRLLEDLRA